MLLLAGPGVATGLSSPCADATLSSTGVLSHLGGQEWELLDRVESRDAGAGPNSAHVKAEQAEVDKHRKPDQHHAVEGLEDSPSNRDNERALVAQCMCKSNQHPARKYYCELVALRSYRQDERQRSMDSIRSAAASNTRLQESAAHIALQPSLDQAQLRALLHNVSQQSDELAEQLRGLLWTDRQLSLLDQQFSVLEEEQSPCPGCGKCLKAHPYAIEDDASEVSDASSNAPEDLSEYFRLARAAFILKERLREMSLDSTDKDAISEGNITASAGSEHEGLIQSLQFAQEELNAQRAKCLDRGLDPERYRHRRISSQSTRQRNVIGWLGHNTDG